MVCVLFIPGYSLLTGAEEAEAAHHPSADLLRANRHPLADLRENLHPSADRLHLGRLVDRHGSHPQAPYFERPGR